MEKETKNKNLGETLAQMKGKLEVFEPLLAELRCG